MQVDLDEPWQPTKTPRHLCEVVVLQVDELKFGALATEYGNIFGSLDGIRYADSAQILPCHLQVRLLPKVRIVMDSRFLTDSTEHEKSRDWLGMLRDFSLGELSSAWL